MQHYINEALSQNGKIAFNDGQVSFKTNSINAILQHLAWQYNDLYIGTIKKMPVKPMLVDASVLTSLSLNSTPLIFNTTSDTTELSIGNKAQLVLQMTYIYAEQDNVDKYVEPKYNQFIITLVNGSWYSIANTNDKNKAVFDAFDDIEDIEYNNLDLPTTKLPKIISAIDSISIAKTALKQYALDNKLEDYAVSTFITDTEAWLTARPSMSKFSSFSPDINEFATLQTSVPVSAKDEIPYLLDNKSKQIIILVDSKWFLIDNSIYFDAIAYAYQDVFIDSVKNTIESNRLNKNLTAKTIYEAVAKHRAIALLNGIQQEFHKSGYFYESANSYTLSHNKFNKYSVNADGYMTKIFNNKSLTLYKDTILTYSVNLDTGIVVLGYPNLSHTLYVTSIAYIDELQNELLNANAKLDTVVTISDIYFTDNQTKKK